MYTGSCSLKAQGRSSGGRSRSGLLAICSANTSAGAAAQRAKRLAWRIACATAGALGRCGDALQTRIAAAPAASPAAATPAAAASADVVADTPLPEAGGQGGAAAPPARGPGAQAAAGLVGSGAGGDAGDADGGAVVAAGASAEGAGAAGPHQAEAEPVTPALRPRAEPPAVRWPSAVLIPQASACHEAAACKPAACHLGCATSHVGCVAALEGCSLLKQCSVKLLGPLETWRQGRSHQSALAHGSWATPCDRASAATPGRAQAAPPDERAAQLEACCQLLRQAHALHKSWPPAPAKRPPGSPADAQLLRRGRRACCPSKRSRKVVLDRLA